MLTIRDIALVVVYVNAAAFLTIAGAGYGYASHLVKKICAQC